MQRELTHSDLVEYQRRKQIKSGGGGGGDKNLRILNTGSFLWVMGKRFENIRDKDNLYKLLRTI